MTLEDAHEERMPIQILGKNIGIGSGWDQVNTVAISFYDFFPNELGKKFLRLPEDAAVNYSSIFINFDDGKVYIIVTEDEAEPIPVTPDWSVFN